MICYHRGSAALTLDVGCDSIRTFHGHADSDVRREMYVFYVGTDPLLVVAHAIVDKILTREEIGDELMDELRMSETFRAL